MSSMVAMEERTGSPCEACFKGHRLEGDAKGTMDRLGGLDYYSTKGNGQHTDKVIVLGTDLFGLGLPNPKLIADWVAEKTGLEVLVPDSFEGDYIDTSRIKPQLDLAEQQTAGKPLVWRIKYQLNTLWTFFYGIGPLYLLRHSPSHTLSLAEKFCLDLRKETGYTHIGFVGYCCGGAHGVHLAGRTDSPKPVDAVVAFHPAPIGAKDFEKIAVPFMLSCAEEDKLFDAMKPAVVATLADLSVPTRVYDDARGTVHGYGARPNLRDEAVKKAFNQGLERTAEWFKEHL